MYADADNIYYVYNALAPSRSDRFDYTAMLPGNTSAALWTEYVGYDRLPSVENPAAGFVQSCNSTPFFTTKDPDNPRRESFQVSAYLEHELRASLRTEAEARRELSAEYHP